MRFGYLAGAYGRLVRALRSKEGFRVSVASVGLAGLLMVLVTGAGLRAFDRSGGKAQPAETAAAPAKPDPWKQRIGSIVFSSPNQNCEEWGFDNRTGHVVSEAVVDCEARLGTPVAQASAVKEVMPNTARIQGILAGFRK